MSAAVLRRADSENIKILSLLSGESSPGTPSKVHGVTEERRLGFLHWWFM